MESRVRWQDLSIRPTIDLEALEAMDPFQLLGVTRGSTRAEVRRAYLALVRAYHPDRLDEFMRRQGERVTRILNAAYERALAALNGDRV